MHIYIYIYSHTRAHSSKYIGYLPGKLKLNIETNLPE